MQASHIQKIRNPIRGVEIHRQISKVSLSPSMLPHSRELQSTSRGGGQHLARFGSEFSGLSHGVVAVLEVSMRVPRRFWGGCSSVLGQDMLAEGHVTNHMCRGEYTILLGLQEMVTNLSRIFDKHGFLIRLKGP